MPSRILKESICTSDTIDELSPEEERFFYRLLVQCDDYGRMDARITIVRSKIFPLKINKFSDEDICRLLARLIEVKLINIYIVASKPYIQVVTWDKHQQIRAKKSKYPDHAPNDNHLITPDNIYNHLISNASEIIGNQTKSNVTVIQSNPIQSNPIPKEVVGVDLEKTTKDKSIEVIKDSDILNDEKLATITKLFSEELHGEITPFTSEELKDISMEYPLDWFREACKIAAFNNARTLKYVVTILHNYSTSGFHPSNTIPTTNKQSDRNNRTNDVNYWPPVR